MNYALLTSRLQYQLFDILRETSVRHEFLDAYVHTVTPVVLRISRDIYAFCIRILQAQLLVDSHPVLDTQYAEGDVSCRLTMSRANHPGSGCGAAPPRWSIQE